MAKQPQFKRILAEDFAAQGDWIGRLIDPINSYFEQVNAALNKQLTLADNLSAAIKIVEVDGQFPVKVMWDLAARPMTVLVGNVYRTDGTSWTQTDPVQVQWSFNQSGQLQIDAVLGLLPRAKTCASGDVDTATDKFTVPVHEFTTGMKVTLTTTTTAPTGLTAGSSYFVVRTDANTFRLATTYDNALAGTYIDITAAGSGTHVFAPAIYKKFKLVLECKTG